MPNLNLLPWRDEFRQQNKRKFFVYLVASIIAGLCVMALLSIGIRNQVETQNTRNQFMKKAIAEIDVKIEVVRELKKKRALLKERMGVIQGLQENRPIIVQVFDAIVRVTPEALYLTRLQMNGRQLSIKGVAESNGQISQLMRRLASSPWFYNPNLTRVKALGDNEEGELRGHEGNYFELSVMRERVKGEIDNESDKFTQRAQ